MHTEKRTMPIPFALSTALFGIFALLTISLSSAHAGEKKDTSKEIEEALVAIGQFTIEQKDRAVAKAGELMEAIDDEMEVWEEEMEENWDEFKDSSKKYYRASKVELRELRQDLSEWYGSMKYSSQETWEDVKEGFSQSYEKMVSALDRKEEEADRSE